MKMLKVGVVATTHGLKGGLKVVPMTDEPERFYDLKWIYLEGSQQKWRIRDVKIRPKDIILQLDDIDSIEQAELLRGKYLYSDETQRPALQEDQYYISDLVGMNVMHVNGELIGTLIRVINTGGHDIYVVSSTDKQKEWMIPAVKAFVKEVSVTKRIIMIDPIEGLLT